MSENEKAGVHVTVTGSAARRRQLLRVLGRVTGVAVCFVFMALGTVFGFFLHNSSTFARLAGRRGLDVLVGAVKLNPLEVWQPEKQYPGVRTMNVMVLGIDRDYTNKDQIIRTANGRSDSILIAHIDFGRKTIAALTIPRDTAVRIPGHAGIHKINAAHSYGGPALTIQTIHDVFGIDTDAVVSVDFDGFQKIVDAVGGIDVNVQKRLKYDDNWGHLHINLYPGYQHLNGYQAMGYVRFRHSDSDFMRSKRQHEFIEAMRTKVKQPATFFKLPAVLDKLTSSFRRENMTEDQMFALANYARSLPRENITLETLPSTEGPSYVSVDLEKAPEVIRRIFHPEQMVAMNIDAPDMSTVRSMNSPYARGGRHRSRHHRSGSRVRTSSSTATKGAARESSGQESTGSRHSSEGSGELAPSHEGDTSTLESGG